MKSNLTKKCTVLPILLTCWCENCLKPLKECARIEVFPSLAATLENLNLDTNLLNNIISNLEQNLMPRIPKLLSILEPPNHTSLCLDRYYPTNQVDLAKFSRKNNLLKKSRKENLKKLKRNICMYPWFKEMKKCISSNFLN